MCASFITKCRALKRMCMTKQRYCSSSKRKNSEFVSFCRSPERGETEEIIIHLDCGTRWKWKRGQGRVQWENIQWERTGPRMGWNGNSVVRTDVPMSEGYFLDSRWLTHLASASPGISPDSTSLGRGTVHHRTISLFGRPTCQTERVSNWVFPG